MLKTGKLFLENFAKPHTDKKIECDHKIFVTPIMFNVTTHEVF